MRTIQILLPILFIPCFCLAQKTDKEVRGDKLFENFFYTKAIDAYQETTGLTTDGARNLGAYRATSKYKRQRNTKLLWLLQITFLRTYLLMPSC